MGIQFNTEEATFDMDRIVEPYPAPEIFATHVGYIDLLPGPCVRLWMVVDDPRHGVRELKAKIIRPADAYFRGRSRVHRWCVENGVVRPEWVGAGIVTKPSGLM